MRDRALRVGDRVRISNSAGRDFKVKDWAYNMPGVIQKLGDFGSDPAAVITYENGLTSFAYVVNLELLDPARAAVSETNSSLDELKKICLRVLDAWMPNAKGRVMIDEIHELENWFIAHDAAAPPIDGETER